MEQERDRLWVAMSDLWLDDELDEERLSQIAEVVRDSGLGPGELEEVFALELAPFLGANQRTVAGAWSGFDPQWVCAEARRQRAARRAPRRLFERLRARLGLTTHAARPAWERVKEIAFAGAR